MLRRFHLIAALDVPNGPTGTFTPLTPPVWACSVLGGDGQGIATIVGRYHAGITTATRVHLRGRIYHVDAIVNGQERDTDLTLTCHEVYD